MNKLLLVCLVTLVCFSIAQDAEEPLQSTICPLNCKACDTNGLCSVCNDGFNITNLGLCGLTSSCGENCSICYQDGTCLQCNVSFFLKDNGTCEECSVAGCAFCASLNVCYACQAGFQLVLNGVCAPLSAISFSNCTANCNACLYNILNNQNLCLQCLPGSYLATSNSCETCPANCTACVVAERCDVCADGFQLDANFVCQRARLLSESNFLPNSNA